MTDASLPPETLRLIDEEDRLQALQAVAAVEVAHSPSTGTWSLEVSPTKHSPVFEPVSRSEIPDLRINGAIREAWAVVARAAQLENAQEAEAMWNAMESNVPLSIANDPDEARWNPGIEADNWTSTQQYSIWNIGPTRITRGTGFALLERTNNQFRLTLVDQQRTPLSQPKSVTVEPALTYLSGKDETVRIVKETIVEPDPSKYDNLFRAIAAGRHLDALLNFKTVIEMPKAIGFIMSWPLCYAFYKILMEKDSATFTNLVYLGSLFWVLKRIGAYVYDVKSNFGTQPV